MRPESVLAHAPNVLDHAERVHYFEKGYVLCRQALGPDWLGRMRDAYESALERARHTTESNFWFSLAPEHSAEKPSVYRIERFG